MNLEVRVMVWYHVYAIARIELMYIAMLSAPKLGNKGICNMDQT